MTPVWCLVSLVSITLTYVGTLAGLYYHTAKLYLDSRLTFNSLIWRAMVNPSLLTAPGFSNLLDLSSLVSLVPMASILFTNWCIKVAWFPLNSLALQSHRRHVIRQLKLSLHMMSWCLISLRNPMPLPLAKPTKSLPQLAYLNNSENTNGLAEIVPRCPCCLRAPSVLKIVASFLLCTITVSQLKASYMISTPLISGALNWAKFSVSACVKYSLPRKLVKKLTLQR